MNEMEIKKKSNDIRSLTENAIIENRDNLEEALEMLKTIKKHKTMISDYWKEAKESAKKTYQNIVSKERQMLDICERCEIELKDKILKYDTLRKSYENIRGETTQKIEIFYKMIGNIKVPKLSRKEESQLIKYFGRATKEKVAIAV